MTEEEPKKKRSSKKLSEEHKRKIGLAHKGIRHTEESKRKLSETRKRMYREGKIIHPWIGRKHTEETKKKISDNHHNCSGSNNSQWKGGIISSRGIKYIHNPGHINSTVNNYVRESRLIMEKKIGRILDKKEVVHHSDSDNTNNDPDNLHLFNNQSEHSKYHCFLRRIVRKEIKNESMC